MDSAMSQLPKVNYIKLVDAWMTGCVAFVFAAFLEFAVVNQLLCREQRNNQKLQVTFISRRRSRGFHFVKNGGDYF